MEASRGVGGADEVEAQEFVDGIHGQGLGRRSCNRGKLELERIAGDGGPFEHQACMLG
jgi:hypothetical protein